MRRVWFCNCLLVIFGIFLNLSDVFAATIVKSFLINSPVQKKCIWAAPPRKLAVGECESAKTSDLYRWRWTTDGQIQNVGSGLCVEVNQPHVEHDNHARLFLAACNYRKRLQKWRCGYRVGNKYLVVQLAHFKDLGRWRTESNGNLMLRYGGTEQLYLFDDQGGANVCDFDHRDHCLQTVTEIPNTTGVTCLAVAVMTSTHGHAELQISGKKPLKDFTISMWVKTRMTQEKRNVVLFSYGSVLSLQLYESTVRITFFDRGIDIVTPMKHNLLSHWTHVSLIRSVKKRTLVYYINDDEIHKERSVGSKALPGAGTLRLGRTRFMGINWFNGMISEFNIYTRALSDREIGEIIQRQHCCNKDMQHGDWLSWNEVTNSWTVHGSARVDRGSECTSFDEIHEKWADVEYSRQICRVPFLVSDLRYVAENRFSSSSFTPAGRASYGRASENNQAAWCPEMKDKKSYLQVDLGYVQNVTAVGTTTILKGRHAKKIKVYYSENGIRWHSDGKVYDASHRLVPQVKIVTLVSPVRGRHMRIYPTGCQPARCCLAVELYGCDPVIDKKTSEPEDGCIDKDKPYILLHLPAKHHITRIQIRARENKKPIGSFKMHYLHWKQWIPYQVNGKTKVFRGNSDTARPFTYILSLPIYTRLVKIFPTSYESSVCSDFKFIGCLPPFEDSCDVKRMTKFWSSCHVRKSPECDLGFVGNGRVCQDMNECEENSGSYCDRNSLCRNTHGSYSCDPCKNNFVGDGRICQTSCEALGITCGANSYCDLDKCKCREGYMYGKNGTDCVDDPDFHKDIEVQKYLKPSEIDGLCPDGLFNCYGDVIGTMDKLRKARMDFENFDYDDCSGY